MARPCRTGLREGILAASLEIGSESGVEGLTMRAIAARLGVSATALYQHFDGKDALLREIRFFGMRRLTETLEGAGDISHPVDRCVSLATRYVMFARQNPWLYGLLMEHAELDWAALAEDERRAFSRPLQLVRDTIRQACERGDFDPSLDADVVSLQTWAGLHGLCSLLLNGRLGEGHPAYPLANTREFVASFVGALIRSYRRAPRVDALGQPAAQPADDRLV